jgi:hypothetical protein
VSPISLSFSLLVSRWELGFGRGERLIRSAALSSRIRVLSRKYEEAIQIMQRATTTPKNLKISYHDEVRLSPFVATVIVSLTRSFIENSSLP